jgi:hypothetical protein
MDMDGLDLLPSASITCVSVQRYDRARQIRICAMLVFNGSRPHKLTLYAFDRTLT